MYKLFICTNLLIFAQHVHLLINIFTLNYNMFDKYAESNLSPIIDNSSPTFLNKVLNVNNFKLSNMNWGKEF